MVVDPGLAKIGSDARPGLDRRRDRVERFAGKCWRRDEVDVVEECCEALAQLLIGRDECVVLAKCTKRGGKCVPKPTQLQMPPSSWTKFWPAKTKVLTQKHKHLFTSLRQRGWRWRFFIVMKLTNGWNVECQRNSLILPILISYSGGLRGILCKHPNSLRKDRVFTTPVAVLRCSEKPCCLQCGRTSHSFQTRLAQLGCYLLPSTSARPVAWIGPNPGMKFHTTGTNVFGNTVTCVISTCG